MNISSEVDELFDAIRENCSKIVISQLTVFGESPFESGVWKLWHNDNKGDYILIEVLEGMLYSINSNQEFSNKYPIDAVKICEFFQKFNKS